LSTVYCTPCEAILFLGGTTTRGGRFGLEFSAIEDSAELITTGVVAHVLFNGSTGAESLALEFGLCSTINVFSHFSVRLGFVVRVRSNYKLTIRLKKY